MLRLGSPGAIEKSENEGSSDPGPCPGRSDGAETRRRREGDQRTLLDAFTKAFNAGDAAAAAATYTETALVVDEEGERIEGRAAIRDQYAASFADNPGSKIAIQVDSLRFLGPETAIEEGRTTITPSREARCTGDHPLHRRVRQARRPVAPGRGPRRDLRTTSPPTTASRNWSGSWATGSTRARMRSSPPPASGRKGGNFIDREFTMKTKGQPVLSGTQRIGWDPLKRQFKTWIFDSEGGHGEGYWTRNGNQWVIKVEGVRQDGQPVSATNIITRLGKDRMSWQSVDRTLGGSAIPGIDEFVVVRTPPEVGK